MTTRWQFLRKVACLPLFILSVAGLGNAQTASSASGKHRIFREDIEWLDIWMPDSNVSNRPRVLLIGDSITRAYNQSVEDALKGKAVVFRLATSKCAADPVFLDELSLVLRQYSFDVIHFNNGIHGMDYSEEAYASGLRKMIATLRKYAPKAHLIWATTTPLRAEGHLDQLDSNNARVVRRNEIASSIMKKAGIVTDDLYHLVLDHPEYYDPDGTHYKENGVAVEAKAVALRIAEFLPK